MTDTYSGDIMDGRQLKSVELDVHYFLAEYMPVFAFVILLLCVWFMREFADRKQFEWHHYPTIFISYFCSVSIMFMSPADLALTINGRFHSDEKARERYLTYGSGDVKKIYDAFVFCCLALNPLLFFQEYFTVSGFYTTCDRFVDTLKKLTKMGIAFGIFAGVMFGIISSQSDYGGNEALKATLTAMQNVYGLFIIVFLLGYGLVEFPKVLWSAGDLNFRIEQKEASTAIALRSLENANTSMVKTIGDVLRTQERFNQDGDSDLALFMDYIVSHCPEKLIGQRNSQGRPCLGAGNKVTKASLAALHSRIIKGRANFKAVQGRVERLKQHVRELEDIKNSINRDDGVEKIAWSLGRPEGSHWEWQWHTQYKDPTCKVCAVLCAILSFTIVMSEIGMMAGNPSAGLSWWYLATHASNSSPASIIFLSLIPLGYITFLCFWSLFRMRLPGMMIMVAGQQSAPKSMSFVARRAVGMAAPLVFLYYGMIFETKQSANNGECDLDDDSNDGDDRIPKSCFVTAFTRTYGTMDDSSIVGNFNIFFPIVTFVVLVIQACNGFNRIFLAIGKPELQFGNELCDEKTLEKARTKMVRERAQLERSVKRAQNMQKIERRRSVLQKAADRISGTDEHIAAAKRELKRMPPTREGYLEKQAPKHGMPSTLKNWRRRYFVLGAPGTLKYYQHEPTKSSEEPAGSIDLRLAVNINLHQGKHTGAIDDHRIDIDMADRKFKIRCDRSEECAAWMDAILAWHDYAVDNSAFHPPDHYVDDDEDDGPFASGMGMLASKPTAKLGTPSPLHPNSGADADVEEGIDSKERASIMRRTSIGGSVRPRELEGHLLKKPSQKHWYSKVEGWADRYFCVRPKEHRLVWYKDDFDAGGEPKGTIDLLLMQEIKDHESKKNPDATRFDIVMSEELVLRLKAPSEQEAERWKQQLQAWQDWLLMHTDRMSYGDESHDGD
jgi:hypothetical protein